MTKHHVTELESFKISPLPVSTARQRLDCALKFISCDHDMHFGVVMVPGDCMPDMVGTIQLMLMLDPEVNEIRTFNGRASGLIFKKDKQSRMWLAVQPEPVPPKRGVAA